MSDVAQLGFIGLGVMGSRMCRNLARKSRKPVIGFDVEPAKAAALADVGVRPAASAAEVVQATDMIFICVPYKCP